MSKVYVTESGSFDKYGFFNGNGIIGVDSKPRFAVGYPISQGYYRHEILRSSVDVIILYKDPDSSNGFRVTSIDAY